MSKTFAPGSASTYAGSSTAPCSKPAVAINSANQIVEAHQDSSGALYYMLGKVSARTWKFTTGAVSMGLTGQGISVALRDGSPNNFVCFAYVDTSGNHMYLRCGEVNWENNTINFTNYGSAMEMGDGGVNFTNISAVSVAINSNGAIVLFFQDSSNNLHYKTGLLNEGVHTILWSNSVPYKDSSNKQQGHHPRIAMSSDNRFVTVHQSQSHDSLYYNLGTVSASTTAVTLTFKLDQDTEYLGTSQDSASTSPAVAINNTGMVFEVHEASGGYDLYFQNGTIDIGNSIIKNFSKSDSKRYFDSYAEDNNMEAINPAVALNDVGYAIHVYEAKSGVLYAAIASVSDRTNWMKDFTHRTLGTLTLPGSHDAGMSVINNETGGTADNTKTQIQDIEHQLKAGLRYFDIRPIFDSLNDTNDIWTGHYSPPGSFEVVGAEGQQMKQVLSQVDDFIRSTSCNNEVVIIKFSHYLYTVGTDHYFSETDVAVETKQTLIDNLLTLISAEMHDSYLYVQDRTNPDGPRITEKKLSEITSNGQNGKVILLFDIRDLAGVTFSKDYVCTYYDLVNPDAADDGYHYIDTNVTKASADWVMYDNYSNTTDVAVMTGSAGDPGQIYRVKQAANHVSDMYLCSWTLTLGGWDSVNAFYMSILENAQNANGILAQQMNTLINNSTNALNADFIPNILYVDAADCFVTDVCININNTADAYLSNLTVNSGTLSPAFSLVTESYNLAVGSSVTQLQVNPTASDSNATVTVNGHTVAAGHGVGVSVNSGATSVPVVVTAQNGDTTRTYTINVTRG